MDSNRALEAGKQAAFEHGARHRPTGQFEPSLDGNALGRFVPVDGTVKAHSVGISFVGILPINQFDLYGRIGYAHSELKFNANGPLGGVANENQRQDEATYGLGGRWNFTPNWGVFVEWFKNDRIRIDSVVGGLDFRF